MVVASLAIAWTERIGSQRGAAGQVELPIDVMQVDLHRPFGERQAAGDLLVRKALGNEAHHLSFPRGELDRALAIFASVHLAGECRLHEVAGKPAPTPSHMVQTVEEGL